MEDQDVMNRLETMEEELDQWGEEQFNDYYQLILKILSSNRNMMIHRVTIIELDR